MSNLKTIELKAFLPATDFELAKNFYQDLGFTQASDTDGVAYFYFENCSFLLHDVRDADPMGPMTMHWLVEDVHAWHQKIEALGLQEKYNISVTGIIKKPWKMLDFIFCDPSGVQWYVGQNIS